MIAFLFRRLVAGIITLWAIATICFFVSRFAPGSPITAEKKVRPEVKKNLERYYGLDKPLHVQYGKVLAGYFTGDMGPSFHHRDQTVNDLIWPAFKVSVLLGVLSFALALMIGIPLGVLSAAKQNKLPDYLAMSISLGGICIPNFLLGPLLILAFSFAIPIFQPAGWPSDIFNPAEWHFIVLPTITLALVHVAYISRLTRAGMLDVMRKDYIRTARAKGLSEAPVFLKHALKNGITPAISYIGPMAAFLITGSIVVEYVFKIEGLGQHFIQSALNRDYGLVMGTVLLYSALIIVFNLAVDLMYSVLDPRVRIQ